MEKARDAALAPFRAAVEAGKKAEQARMAAALAESNKTELIRSGRLEVIFYLAKLGDRREISQEERSDPRLRERLQRAVTEMLEKELTGNEESSQVDELVHDVVDDELGFEDDDEDS
jgi:hypothetical protein